MLHLNNWVQEEYAQRAQHPGDPSHSDRSKLDGPGVAHAATVRQEPAVDCRSFILKLSAVRLAFVHALVTLAHGMFVHTCFEPAVRATPHELGRLSPDSLVHPARVIWPCVGERPCKAQFRTD